MTEAQALLNNYSLRRTTGRIKILEIFMQQKIALSEGDIETKINGLCDRATIYRTLKTFLNQGLIHKVLDENSIVKYALCKTSCTPLEHNHEHVHFKCKECGTTNCLEDIPIQKVNLPQGFQVEESNLLIIGVCNTCNLN